MPLVCDEYGACSLDVDVLSTYPDQPFPGPSIGSGLVPFTGVQPIGGYLTDPLGNPIPYEPPSDVPVDMDLPPLVVDVYAGTPEPIPMDIPTLEAITFYDPVPDEPIDLNLPPLTVDVYSGTPEPTSYPPPNLGDIFRNPAPLPPGPCPPGAICGTQQFVPLPPPPLYTSTTQTPTPEAAPMPIDFPSFRIPLPGDGSIDVGGGGISTDFGGFQSNIPLPQAGTLRMNVNACQPGYHIRKKPYRPPGPRAGQSCVPRRHMNMCNQHALRRATRRLNGFFNVVKSAEKAVRSSLGHVLPKHRTTKRTGGCYTCGRPRSSCTC